MCLTFPALSVWCWLSILSFPGVCVCVCVGYSFPLLVFYRVRLKTSRRCFLLSPQNIYCSASKLELLNLVLWFSSAVTRAEAEVRTGRLLDPKQSVWSRDH